MHTSEASIDFANMYVIVDLRYLLGQCESTPLWVKLIGACCFTHYSCGFTLCSLCCCLCLLGLCREYSWRIPLHMFVRFVHVCVFSLPHHPCPVLTKWWVWAETWLCRGTCSFPGRYHDCMVSVVFGSPSTWDDWAHWLRVLTSNILQLSSNHQPCRWLFQCT